MAFGCHWANHHKPMKPITTRQHGILDYIIGLALIIAPFVWPKDENDPLGHGIETYIPVAAGVMILLLTLLTDFEAGVSRQIPVGTHLTIDVIAGLLLAASPWLFGFADYIYLPHLISGLAYAVIALLTQRVPSYLANRTGYAGGTGHAGSMGTTGNTYTGTSRTSGTGTGTGSTT